MRLKTGERCPIHGRRDCCGRDTSQKAKQSSKWIVIGPGIKKHRETGLIRRSPATMRILVLKKLAEQLGVCGICGLAIEDVREAVADHIAPRGMGGARRDDSETNIQAAHSLCNMRKGSRRDM